MILLISLPILPEIPSDYLKMCYSAADVVLAMYDILYPGCVTEDVPATARAIANCYISANDDVVREVFAIGPNGLARNNIEDLGPGAVKIYAKNYHHH